MSLRVAGGLLAVSGKDGAHRFGVPRLRRARTGGGKGRQDRDRGTGRPHRPCLGAPEQVDAQHSLLVKHDELLPVGRTSAQVGRVQRKKAGRDHHPG